MSINFIINHAVVGVMHCKIGVLANYLNNSSAIDAAEDAGIMVKPKHRFTALAFCNYIA